MTTGAIEFACPYCDRVTRVPATFGGKQGKCPGCQQVVEVPLPGEVAPGGPGAAPGVAPPPSNAIGTPVEGAEPGPAGAGAMKPCPFCGERILAAAKKCKYCGEFLDEAARRQRRSAGAVNLPYASRGKRFVARLLDDFVLRLPFMAIMIGGVVMAEASGRGRNNELFAIGGMLAGMLLMFLFLCFQWYLIATTGASLGKRWLGLKIVRLDGGPVGFVDGVLLREWVIGGMVFVGNFLYLGCCVALVDGLMIFAEDRRTLHDHIASTTVIEV